MGKSQHVGARDICRVYQLLGQCTELWADPPAWREHLCRGAKRLLAADYAAYAAASVADAQPPVAEKTAAELAARTAMSGLDAAGRRQGRCAIHDASLGMVAICGHARKLELIQRNGYVASVRQELATDRQWYSSPWFQDYRRPADCDQFVIAVRPLGRDRLGILSCERTLGRPAFGDKAARLLKLLTAELAPLVGTRLATDRHRSLVGLSPRCRQTLACLLEGHGEQEIATRLGLSRRTVHQYVEMLYRHFAVHSRAELMAYFVRRRPAPIDGSNVNR